MPTLAQATSYNTESLEMAPAASAKPLSSGSGRQPSYLRSPTPPTGASPDILNLFTQNSSVPQRRIFSVPQLGDTSNDIAPSSLAASPATTVSLSVGSGGGSGSGTSIIRTAAVSTNAAITTTPLNQNDTFVGPVQIARTFVLLGVAVDQPCRVRIYSNAAGQTGDMVRSAATPILLGASMGIIADFDLSLPSEANWTCSPAVLGFNADNPRSASIYLAVTNTSPATKPITVSFTYLPLEL